MAFSRAFSVISIISVSWLAAVGCGDDDDNKQQPGAAGEGGEAGQAVGGTRAGAGEAGNGAGGTGGSAGDAGNGTGGTAGDAGAGVGGQPVIGGAGGEPPVTIGGAAGEGGAGGAGGDGPVALGAKQCANECEIDDDCFIDEINVRVCDLETKRCVDPLGGPCTESSQCFPLFNGWAPCATSAECDESQVCATWEGDGYCVARNIDGCNEGDLSRTLGEFGKVDSPVNVCMTSAACYQGACQPGCEMIGCEGSGIGETCGQTTHLCECSENTECEDTEVCGADHQCAECVTDQDCIEKNGAGLDKCYEGKCGCAGALSCPDVPVGATPVCE